MGGNNIISSFSYHVDDRQMVARAEKIARDLNISFSDYVVRCLRASDPHEGETQKQKKEIGPSENTRPIELGSKEISIKEVNKPDIETNDPFDITKYIAAIDDCARLRKLRKNAHVIDTVAFTRLKRVIATRIEQ